MQASEIGISLDLMSPGSSHQSALGSGSTVLHHWGAANTRSVTVIGVRIHPGLLIAAFSDQGRPVARIGGRRPAGHLAHVLEDLFKSAIYGWVDPEDTRIVSQCCLSVRERRHSPTYLPLRPPRPHPPTCHIPIYLIPTPSASPQSLILAAFACWREKEQNKISGRVTTRVTATVGVRWKSC